MSATFDNAQNADPDVSGWDTSNVIQMDRMFQTAKLANPDVSGWDTSRVTTMSNMFKQAEIATPDVSTWNVDQVTKMDGMFSLALLANPDVTGWNTSNVTDMLGMFRSANSFTGDLSGLETGNVTNMNGMFWNNTTVDPNTNNWDTSKVESMAQMFAGATSATLLTNGLETQMVTSMYGMFEGATSANPETSLWDTAQVTDMQRMFKGAINANPDMSNWDFSQVNFFSSMFEDVTLPITTYDALLINLANTVGLSINEHFHGGNSIYCSLAAQQAHADLINDFNWTITDGSACAGVNPNVAPSFSITCDIDVTDVIQYDTGPEDKSIKGGFTNGFVSFTNFISNISVGPASESLQTFTLTASIISDPDLVLGNIHPGTVFTIGADGYVEFGINDQSSGVATLELTMRDTGGTGNGGVDTTSQQFNIFYFSDLSLDPDLPLGIVYKNTFDPCRHIVIE
jgi:surface protein